MIRTRFTSPLFLRLLPLLALLLAVTAVRAQQDVWSGVERIVAVGDVHGDYEQFAAVLRSAEVMDEKENWAGGKTHLVQTGDVLDRGPDSRKVMDLLKKLEKQAKRAKGYVHALIGNHESMNIFGDLRYVHPGEYAAFKNARSERTRDAFYERHVEELKRNPPAEGLPEFDQEYREKWEKERPLGYFEHRLAFSPRGEYGRWILKHNTVIKINDTLFLHGGIGPKYVSFSLREINDQVREELKDFSKLRGGMVVDSEGPLWYRGLARHPEEAERPHVEAVLAQHDAKHIVIGHTPTMGTVIPRFGGRVILIDVGLAQYYGGRLACLVIEGDKLYTIHRGKKLELPTGSGPGLLSYLRQAAALDPSPSPLESMIQTVEAQLSAN